jgi:transcriptional regulator with GAF, ATPase, and Fis domain
MDRYRALYEIAKLLLSEDDSRATAEILLRRLLGATGAERGFIVVREGESFEQKFDVHFDRERLSGRERQFSRTLVRRAIETQQILYSPNVEQDERFAGGDSVGEIGPSCVLAVPLRHGGEVYGVVYLERRGPPQGLGDEERQFASECAELAGLFLHRAIESEALRRRNRSLERDLFAQNDFEGIVTRDPRMLELLRAVAQVADSNATVLVLGETGTGKELIARALHLNSSRRSRPFVALHCSAIPGAILESELFGHVRGAFTGADRERAGRIASAAGGTLLLDEVAEIVPEVQAKLLRFLQFGEIQRVGSDRTDKVDVRVLAATHQDLAALVRAGRFRQDLYFRLAVVELRIPPLRERRGDVLLLAEHFLRKHASRAQQRLRLSQRSIRALRAYELPGNVRELEHLVERAFLLSGGAELELDMPLQEPEPAATAVPWSFDTYSHAELKSAREAANVELERQYVHGLLERHGGNVSQAAREAGIHRTYLQRLVTQHRPAKPSAARPQ